MATVRSLRPLASRWMTASSGKTAQSTLAGVRFASNAASPSRHVRTGRILVVDGYTQAGRDDLEAGGATTAGVLYDGMLRACAPPGVELSCDIIYPSDDNFNASRAVESLEEYDAVAWTGCSLSLATPEDKRVACQIELCRSILTRGLPQFGSCWAMQMACVAAGGRCLPNPRGREMGIARKIRLTPEGRSHPMYEGKPAVFDAFIAHDDEIVTVPDGVLHLATNAFTMVQAVDFTGTAPLPGRFWAVQYHPEYDLHEVARLTHCRREKLIRLGHFQSMAQADAYVEEMEQLFQEGPAKRKDLAWKYAIDADVLDARVRTVEVRNWLAKIVAPRLA